MMSALKDEKAKDKDSKVDRMLEAALASINKDLKTTLERVKDKKIEPVERISSGSISLDIAMGGGWARGRLHEIYGHEGAGKTMQTLFAVANTQKKNLNVAFIDTEHALDPEWAAGLGVDIDNMFFEQPEEGEQALELVDRLCRTGKFGLIVVDSVAGLVPKSTLEGEMGKQQIGAHARMMSQAIAKIKTSASVGNTAVIFVNQIRNKIGVMFGNPETTTGGMALKFYASLRLEVRKLSKTDGGVEIQNEQKEALGHTQRVKIIKNKTAPPFKEAAVPILYLSGIRLADDTIFGLQKVTKVDDAPIEIAGGSYKSFGDLHTAILADEKLLKKVRQEIYAKAGLA